MIESAPPRPLRLGRGLRVLNVGMVQQSGEVEEYDFSHAAMTVLTGPRNSSKTTTLKVIDFCFGGRGSVAEELGAAIDEKYAALSVNIAIDGVHYRLLREFEHGRRGRVKIDDDTDLLVGEVSEWLLGKLGWPSLSIPLGRNAITATQQTPLTFRSALRHIYRREDSWTDFAAKEQEYLRRAVVSLFLGFAPQRYETADYDLGQAQREIAAAEAVFRDVLTSTDESVRAVVSQLGLPPVLNSDSLGGVRAELMQRLAAVRSQRDSITDSAALAAQSADGMPGFDPDLPARLEHASAQAAGAAEEAASLRLVVAEHERSRSLVASDIARLHRLVDAVDIFDELPVRICPACEQSVDPKRPHDDATCYLCMQPVSGDIRRRRAEREQRALATEQEDLGDALSRAQADLDGAHRMEASATKRRARLAHSLQDARVSRLAPFMAALEDVATEIGRVEQQLAALPALETILSRRVAAEQAVKTARREVARLSDLGNADARGASDTSERCAELADHMNDFLSHFQDRGWVAGLVTVSADDLTFYVGTRPWEDNLGAEARVLFFLAYSFALLHLSARPDQRTCAPGLLLLDNPYQQGLSADVVVDAISRIANAAERLGTQVVVTQARNADAITAPHIEIRMPQEYAT